MKTVWIPGVLILLAGIGGLQLWSVQESISELARRQASQRDVLEQLSAAFYTYSDQLEEASSVTVAHAAAEIDTYTASKVASATSAINQMTYEALEAFRVELAAVERDLLAAREALSDARGAVEGRPPFVSFEDAFAANLGMVRRAPSSATLPQLQPSVTTFVTSAGNIAFSASDFTFEWVPSTGEPAWFRIGKQGSTISSELIQAFIAQAIAVKRSEGYVVFSDRTYDAAYGEVEEKILKVANSVSW